METFVMGDVHGAYKALLQCLERSRFDYEEDKLIQLGDVVDGFEEVYECVEEFLKVKHLIAIKGNHDDWFNEFIQTGYHPQAWAQRGKSTALSYMQHAGKKNLITRFGEGYKAALSTADIPGAHQQFFLHQSLYYIDDDNNCFVHAGFDRHLDFKAQQPFVYFWDRNLWTEALSFNATARGEERNVKFKMTTEFKNIFIGHTPTLNWMTDEPMQAANIYNVDTGAGHSGKLTIMNVKTKQYWQSDSVTELYK